MLLFLSTFIYFFFHPHYQSVTEINYSEDALTFEISMTMTSHDVEQALSHKLHKKLSSHVSEDSLEISEVLFDYVERNFQMNMGNLKLNFGFLGFESDKNECTVYFESEELKGFPESLRISNTVLMETFSEQQNIIRVLIDSIDISRKLTLKNSEMYIKI
ncbi:MAG: DUF6702 family protein [Saprospiraceae bacterium]